MTVNAYAAESKLKEIINKHPGALNDRRIFIGLLKDYLQGMPLYINLLINQYDMEIYKELESATQVDSTFTYRYIKKQCDEYGVLKANAEWAVNTWCSSLGKPVVMSKTTKEKSNNTAKTTTKTQKQKHKTSSAIPVSTNTNTSTAAQYTHPSIKYGAFDWHYGIS